MRRSHGTCLGPVGTRATGTGQGARLKRCCEQINKDLDVDDLCRAFPKRCKLLDDAEGGRLRH
jgi:hypothetical protein